MKIILDISELYLSILRSHGFIAECVDNSVEVAIEPYNPIELQRLALVLEQYE